MEICSCVAKSFFTVIRMKTIRLKFGNSLFPRTLLAVSASCLLGISLHAADWPQFLGPSRNGTSPETGLLEKWDSKGPKVLWQKDIGTGYCSPSIIGDKLVYFDRVGGNEIVHCVDKKSGTELWSSAYPSKFQDPYGYNNGPRSQPLLTASKCYTFGAEGMIRCLDLKDGKIVWEMDTAKQFDIPEAFFGVGSAPVLEDNLLIMAVGGQPNSGVVALNPETGTVVWESVGEKNWTGIPMTGWPGEKKVEWRKFDKQASYSTPTVATVNGRKLIFCLMRQGLVALESKTGACNFTFWFRSRADDSVNAMSPIVVDNDVLVSGAYYKVGSVLLRVHPENKEFHEIWRATSLEMHWNTPIYFDGYLYGFSGRNEPDAHLRCVHFKSGELMWDHDETWVPHSTPQPSVYGRGSMIMADGRLIALGEGGMLGLFQLNSRKMEEICRAQLLQMEHPCWSTPALSDKRLYIRSEKKLICLALARE
jgi:outer membrane protein assembly factor BamB